MKTKDLPSSSSLHRGRSIEKMQLAIFLWTSKTILSVMMISFMSIWSTSAAGCVDSPFVPSVSIAAVSTLDPCSLSTAQNRAHDPEA